MGTYSIICIAGPKREINQLNFPKGTFDVVHKFETPDDHGEFPDTTGYTKKNWEMLESAAEDPALWFYMQKCLDATLDYTMKKGEMLEKLNFVNIREDMHWPKFGGKVFAVCGFVHYDPMPVKMGNQIVIN